MARSSKDNKDDANPTSSDATASGDAAKGDVQEQVDRAEEQGFVGTEVDPVPNEEYTLTTGPDSPRGVNSPNERQGQTTREEGNDNG